jgi:hypothetical protein
MWPIAVYMVIRVLIIHGVEVVLVLVEALSEGLNGLLNVVLAGGVRGFFVAQGFNRVQLYRNGGFSLK